MMWMRGGLPEHKGEFARIACIGPCGTASTRITRQGMNWRQRPWPSVARYV